MPTQDALSMCASLGVHEDKLPCFEILSPEQRRTFHPGSGQFRSKTVQTSLPRGIFRYSVQYCSSRVSIDELGVEILTLETSGLQCVRLHLNDFVRQRLDP